MKKDVNVSLVQGGKLTKSGWLSIVAILLVAIIALSVALGLVVKAGKEERSAEEASVGGGMVLPEETAGNGLSLVSTVIPEEQYAEYDIVPIAESAYTVTATAKDNQGTALPEAQQKFKWSMAWASSNSTDVNTYVTMSESGGKTATFSCLKAFSTKIIVTCAAEAQQDKSATCTLDYAKRLTGVKVSFFNSEQTIAKSGTTVTTTFKSIYEINPQATSPCTDIEFSGKQLQWYTTFEYGIGTVENTCNCDYTIVPSSALKSAYAGAKNTYGENLGDLKDSISVPHQAGSSADHMWTVNGFYRELMQITNSDSGVQQGTCLYRLGGYCVMSTALYNTSSQPQFTVKLALSFKYGDSEQYTYSLKVLMDKAPVGSVALDHTSYVF